MVKLIKKVTPTGAVLAKNVEWASHRADHNLAQVLIQ